MKQTTRDNLIYLGVALAIVAAGVSYAFYTESTTGRIRVPSGTVVWGLFSVPGVDALVLNGFWKYRRRRALWAIVAAVTVINVSVVAFAYHRGWDPPVLWWSIPTGFLMIPLFVITAKILGSETGRPTEEPGRGRRIGVRPPGVRGNGHG